MNVCRWGRWRALLVDRRRRVGVALGALTLIAALIGMHQLSVDHTLATGQSAATPGQHSAGASIMHAAVVAGTTLTDAVRAVGGADDGCQGGCDHPGAMALCLLVLTLVVGAWLLRRPGSGSWTSRRSGATVDARLIRGGWRRPALTLAELSLRRT